jgi:hypothetical protein
MFSDFASKGLLLLYAGLAVANGAPPLYKDPKADINHRVSDLLGRMTIEEKAAQLLQGTGIEFSTDSFCPGRLTNLQAVCPIGWIQTPGSLITQAWNKASRQRVACSMVCP